MNKWIGALKNALTASGRNQLGGTELPKAGVRANQSYGFYRFLSRFAAGKCGSIGVGILAGIMVALGCVLIFTIAIPMAMEGERQNVLSQALLTLAENDYVAYGAPTGDWTTLGDLYTQDIYPQGDSTYNVGTNTNRYLNGYYDNLYASNSTITALDAPTGRGATYVIAASDATATEIAQADVVCDGVTDSETINTVVDTLAAINGGTILLTSGTFYGRFYIDQPNIIMCGNGMYSTILKLPDEAGNAQTLTIVADYVTVEQLQIDGNSANQTIPGGAYWAAADGIAAYGDYITIQECYVHDTLAHGVIFWTVATDAEYHADASNAARIARDRVTNNKVLFSRFLNCGSPAYGGHAIDSAYDTSYFSVLGNYVESTGTEVGEAGIGWHGGYCDVIADNHVTGTVTGIGVHGEYGDASRILIANNTLADIAATSAERGSISVYNAATDVIISGNVITGGTNEGILVGGVAGKTEARIQIVDNLIKSPGKDGIRFNQVSEGNISGNQILATPNGYDGVVLEASTNLVSVTNNHFTGCGDYGISVSGGSNYNGIFNNHITTADAGIRCTGTVGTRLTGVTVTGNIIRNVTASIVVTYTDNVLLDGNTIYDSGGIGIDCEYDSYVDVKNNKVINSTSHGVLFAVVQNGMISNNEIVTFGANSAGIRVGTGVSDNIVVQSNMVDGSGTSGTGFYVIATATSVSVTDNYVTGVTTPIDLATPANVVCLRNYGYITPGEARTASGTLTAGNANAICFAWHNPEAQDIYVTKVTIAVTTGGGTAGSHLDVGIADDATGTNRGTELFDDLLLENISINESLTAGDGGTQTKWVLTQDSASATDGWVVGQILDANAASLVGSYYIEYIGK